MQGFIKINLAVHRDIMRRQTQAGKQGSLVLPDPKYYTLLVKKVSLSSSCSGLFSFLFLLIQQLLNYHFLKIFFYYFDTQLYFKFTVI